LIRMDLQLFAKKKESEAPEMVATLVRKGLE